MDALPEPGQKTLLTPRLPLLVLLPFKLTLLVAMLSFVGNRDLAPLETSASTSKFSQTANGEPSPLAETEMSPATQASLTTTTLAFSPVLNSQHLAALLKAKDMSSEYHTEAAMEPMDYLLVLLKESDSPLDLLPLRSLSASPTMATPLTSLGKVALPLLSTGIKAATMDLPSLCTEATPVDLTVTPTPLPSLLDPAESTDSTSNALPAVEMLDLRL